MSEAGHPGDRFTPRGFDCTKCGKCCTGMSRGRDVLFGLEDVDRAAQHLGISRIDFISRHLEHKRLPPEYGEPADVFVLRHAGDRCTFLAPDDTCSIHDARPVQCRRGPFGLYWPQARDTDYDCLEGLVIPATWSTERNDREFLDEVRFDMDRLLRGEL